MRGHPENVNLIPLSSDQLLAYDTAILRQFHPHNSFHSNRPFLPTNIVPVAKSASAAAMAHLMYSQHHLVNQKPETFMLSTEAQQSLPQEVQVALQQVDNCKRLLDFIYICICIYIVAMYPMKGRIVNFRIVGLQRCGLPCTDGIAQ